MQGIWRVFALWMADKKKSPADVAKDFVSKYQGLNNYDVEWMVKQFIDLSAEEIHKTERRLRGYAKYSQPKAFPLAQNIFTPTVEKAQKSTSNNHIRLEGDVQKPKKHVDSKVRPKKIWTLTNRCLYFILGESQTTYPGRVPYTQGSRGQD